MKVLKWLIKILDKVVLFSRWTSVIGMVGVFIMVCLTFSDVIRRYIFNQAITGAMEITEVLLAISAFSAVAYTQAQKGHVSVDVITFKLSTNTRLIVEFISNLLGISLFVVIIWRIGIQTLKFFAAGAWHGSTIHIPASPFALVIMLGCTAMGLILIRDLLVCWVKAIERNFKWYHWTMIIAVSIVIFLLMAAWTQRGLIDIDLSMVGFLGVVVSLILILMGMPIAFALFITGLLFTGHIRGMKTAFLMLGRDIYSNSTEYVWATVAFFVMMGFFCLIARFGEDLYVLFNRWIGRLRGGLAMATTASCTGFAAIVGDSVSSIATMTAVALPEMKKYDYDNRLSTGSIAGGSIIGPIIPPSVPFIIYGILTNVSIGALFMAGIIPGVLLGLSFIVAISIWCHINPKLGPRGEPSTWRLKFSSLKASAPILVLFLIVIGGIYGGVFSPSEGGAMGAAGALIIGLIMRRVTWQGFLRALRETAKILSMMLLLINGASTFIRFVAWCNISDQVANLFSGFGLSANGTVFVILLTFFLLGFIVDIMTLTLIGVPILHPIAVSMGADPVWFAILVMLVMTLGTLTPPIGLNLFTMKAMAADIPIETIYKGAIPFIIAAVVSIAIVFMIPALATWLPNKF